MKKHQYQTDRGFSIVELLIVLIIISILSAITGYYLSAHSKLYKPDEQALKIADIFQEARQRALTQRQTMRVEIDLVDNIVRLIDEKTSSIASDDKLIRQLALLPTSEVKINTRPSDITYNPPETLPAPTAVFTPSIYPTSTPHSVCTLRFQSNGTIVNAGNNATGNNAVTTGATLHIWSPQQSDPNQSDIARAITIIGSSGSIRMWEFDRSSTASNKWKDSRRTSGFGGTGGTPTPTP